MTILETIKGFLKENNNAISYKTLTTFMSKNLDCIGNQCFQDVLIDDTFKFKTKINNWNCDIIIYLSDDIPEDSTTETPLKVKNIIVVIN